MAKVKKTFFCRNCGHESAKWLGCCPSCGEWNTFVEEIVSKPTTSAVGINNSNSQAQLISDIDFSNELRIDLNSAEVNRILGGGLVCGSMILIGGEPGIGKSTLSLQIALNCPKLKTLYVSGEESAQQIKIRSTRLGAGDAQCYVLSETLLETIIMHSKEIKPDILIIDSIQTLYTERIDSSAGSISQIRDCAMQLLKFAKETNTPIFVIGHITKDGTLAGPKVLEHIVDVVLQFEGDNNHAYRILRAAKNRFGSTAEIGIFEMQHNGLREIENPSEILISQHNDSSFSGVAIAATMDGARPLFIETQSLVSTAAYGVPQRSTTGIDVRRLNMLLAVLEKRAGFRLATKDVFFNITGGLRISDTAADMAIVSSVLSSNFDISIPIHCCFCAEVGLTGEFRPVPHINQRIIEAARLNFKKIFISKYNKLEENLPPSIEIISVAKIEELMKNLFRRD
ncbi:MAG: DNA repair protein RadA [Prevotellaceae bacterium]|jgi:DNA repair protein RadA/Sms|nr:DNA repair protein RadA [Prevotellaceae bacterium]